MPEIKLKNQSINYTVRTSRRARHVRLTIKPDTGLEIVIPVSAKSVDIQSILQKRADWIIKNLQEVKSSQHPRTYQPGDIVHHLGQPLTIAHQMVAQSGKIALTRRDNQLIFKITHDHQPDTAELKAALGQWLHGQARTYIIPRTHELAKQHGFTVNQIRIKDQKTRWGSASSLGNLNFNRRLMMAPPPVIDYLIIHELCHFREMNHSRKFWALVKQYCPDYRHQINWLKTNPAIMTL